MKGFWRQRAVPILFVLQVVDGLNPLTVITGACIVKNSTLSSPNYPNIYPKNTDCEIRVNVGGILRVESFVVESCCDHFNIQGESAAQGDTWSSTTNYYYYDEVATGPDGVIVFVRDTITFRSDESTEVNGFRISLEVFSPSPSRLPSPAPTSFPSTIPAPLPTEHPSGSPSIIPTAAPTTQPSFKPSLPPSQHPSPLPTGVPVNHPSLLPTLVPIPVPTLIPTAAPTSQPSFKPSAPPSQHPSPLPSLIPTRIPTEEPTPIPTIHPSTIPSMVPSTSFPSNSPTTVPSPKPSAVPTSLHLNRFEKVGAHVPSLILAASGILCIILVIFCCSLGDERCMKKWDRKKPKVVESSQDFTPVKTPVDLEKGAKSNYNKYLTNFDREEDEDVVDTVGKLRLRITRTVSFDSSDGSTENDLDSSSGSTSDASSTSLETSESSIIDEEECENHRKDASSIRNEMEYTKEKQVEEEKRRKMRRKRRKRKLKREERRTQKGRGKHVRLSDHLLTKATREIKAFLARAALENFAPCVVETLGILTVEDLMNDSIMDEERGLQAQAMASTAETASSLSYPPHCDDEIASVLVLEYGMTSLELDRFRSLVQRQRASAATEAILRSSTSSPHRSPSFGPSSPFGAAPRHHGRRRSGSNSSQRRGAAVLAAHRTISRSSSKRRSDAHPTALVASPQPPPPPLNLDDDDEEEEDDEEEKELVDAGGAIVALELEAAGRGLRQGGYLPDTQRSHDLGPLTQQVGGEVEGHPPLAGVLADADGAGGRQSLTGTGLMTAMAGLTNNAIGLLSFQTSLERTDDRRNGNGDSDIANQSAIVHNARSKGQMRSSKGGAWQTKPSTSGSTSRKRESKGRSGSRKGTTSRGASIDIKDLQRHRNDSVPTGRASGGVGKMIGGLVLEDMGEAYEDDDYIDYGVKPEINSMSLPQSGNKLDEDDDSGSEYSAPMRRLELEKQQHRHQQNKKEQRKESTQTNFTGREVRTLPSCPTPRSPRTPRSAHASTSPRRSPKHALRSRKTHMSSPRHGKSGDTQSIATPSAAHNAALEAGSNSKGFDPDGSRLRKARQYNPRAEPITTSHGFGLKRGLRNDPTSSMRGQRPQPLGQDTRRNATSRNASLGTPVRTPRPSATGRVTYGNASTKPTDLGSSSKNGDDSMPALGGALMGNWSSLGETFGELRMPGLTDVVSIGSASNTTQVLVDQAGTRFSRQQQQGTSI